LATSASAIQHAGLEIRHVENLREVSFAYSAAPRTSAADGLALLASLAATRHEELTGSGP